MARLELRLLGPLQVLLDGNPITSFESAKVRGLLACLAAEAPRPQFRESLAELLWPGWPQESAMSNLRYALADLRKNLGDRDNRPPFLIITRESIQLDPDSDIWVDTLALNHAVSSANIGETLCTVDGLYRGPFLEGFSLAEAPEFAEWLISKRAYYNQQVLSLLDRCVERCRETGDYTQGLALARRGLAIESWREESHQQVMYLLALSGHRSAALAQYEECRRLLMKDLGVALSAETLQLFESIRAGSVGGKTNRQPEMHPEYVPVSNGHHHNLPVQMTSFIGREREIAAVLQLLQKHRLVTLTGSGGTGKTRLSVQAARELLGDMPDGAWLVELGSMVDPDELVHAVAGALGLQGSADMPVLDVLTGYLKQRVSLIILDNCEHMIEACAFLAEHLLRVSPGLCILASSREPLGIPGELVFRVPCLSFPTPEDESAADPIQLAQYESIRLFAERAALAQPGFDLNQTNARVVSQICRRLDGIPLALELAAARTGSLSIEQIAARLKDRFRLLTGGSRTALPRQQTLRASIDWSYSQLSGSEQLLLQRLSVFAGGWTLEAAEGICGYGEIDPLNVFDTLSALVQKSLVAFIEDTSRYRILETIRQYAREKLADEGGVEELRRRHLNYFLRFAQQIEPELHGFQRAACIDRLFTELDNLRAALEWGLEDDLPESVIAGIRLLLSGSEVLKENGLVKEGLNWSESYQERLEQQGQLTELLLARLAYENADLLFRIAIFERSNKYLEDSIALFRQLGEPIFLIRSLSFYCSCFEPEELISKEALVDEAIQIANEAGLYEQGKAELLFMKAQIAAELGSLEEGQCLMEESLAICEQNNRPADSITRLRLLGQFAEKRGDEQQAFEYVQKALWLSRVLKSKYSMMWDLTFSGDIAYALNRYSEMYHYFEECQIISEKIGFQAGYLWGKHHQGVALRRIGEKARAAALALDSLDLAQEYESAEVVLESICSLAGILLEAGELPAAGRLLAATRALTSTIHLGVIVKAELTRDMEEARTRLGVSAFETACEEGQGLTLEQAAKEARQSVQAILISSGNFS
jgi:predicted ATPase